MYRKIKVKTALLFSLCCLLVACEKGAPPAKEVLPTPVTVASPTVRDISLYVESVGILEPSFYVDIRPQVGGLIAKIFVQQGDFVEAEAPLFQVDPKALQINVKEAQAQLLMDQAAYDAAQKKYERFQRLAQKDLVAQVEWDEIEMQAAKAKAILDSDRAKLETALLEVERCTLLAPGSGRIGRYDLYPGTLVSKEQVLTSLTRSDPLIVNFTLTEKDFAKLPKGALSCTVHLLCGIPCSRQGKITFLDSRFDEKSGLIFLRGEVENHDQLLRPGQSVSVRVPVAVEPQKVVIPQRAVKYNQQGPYVYVVSAESTLEFRQLILGEDQGEEVVVLEGVAAAEPVVTSSHSRLSPGLKVDVEQ